MYSNQFFAALTLLVTLFGDVPHAYAQTWGSPQTPDATGVVGQYTSLAVVNGQPAISYYDNTNFALKYIRATDADGSAWGSPQTLDATGAVGQYTSLAVVNGHPAISYFDITNLDLKYIRATDVDGTVWDSPQTLDATGTVGRYPSLAVVNGQPAISYFDETNQDLKYIRATDADGTVWDSPQTLDAAGFDNSLAVVNGHPAISYYANGDLKYIRATATLTPGVTVALDTAFAAPGDTAKLNVLLDNTGSVSVGGLEVKIYLGDMTKATFTGISDTLMGNTDGFTVMTTVSNDTLKVVVFSGSSAVLEPGEHLIGRLCFYLIDDNANLGMEVPVTLDALEVGDDVGQLLASDSRNGQLQIGIRGDVNLNGGISILDVIQTVRIIVGEDAPPDTGSVAYNIADMDDDGNINIVDVILQVNTILGLAKPLAIGPTTPVVVGLDAVQTLSNGQLVIPVMLEADGVVAGAQATFTFDPTQLKVGTPQIVGDATELTIDSHVVNGTLQVVVYGTTPGTGIAAGQDAVLHIPVTVRDGITGTPSLTLADILMVDPQAQLVSVTMGQTIVTLTKDGATAPTTFALDNARPNPFNPSTRISYDVSQQAHITLVVYNLLGQEVVKLVDQVKVPGRYTAIWSGTNAQGTNVASGIYMYRLTNSAGYSEMKRMLLLK